MSAVAGLDVGGSSVKAWVATVAGVVAEVTEPLVTDRPDDRTAEMDPQGWWRACHGALARVVEQAGRQEWAGLTVSSLRQGFVLLDADGAELGPGVLNSDRRGADQLERLRDHGDVERVTGHWLAPELTLPKLLHLAEVEPDRWAATRRLLFVHDWLLWRLAGVQVSELSYVSAGQCADVRARGWATGLLDDLGLGAGWCAEAVEAGTVVGALTDASLGLPPGLPVVAGCGDTQLAAMGAGGLGAGVVTVVAGSSTPVIAAVDRVDGRSRVDGGYPHAWVSTHARRDLWAVETNCGYPGAMAGWARQTGLTAEPSGRPGAGGVVALTGTPTWSERAWSQRPPMTLLGMTQSTSAADVAQAFAEAHAFAIRGNLDDLEQQTGPADRVVLTGGAGAAAVARLVATVCGRPVDLVAGSTAAAGWALVTGEAVPVPQATTVAPGDGDHEQAYRRWVAAYLAALA